jgi:hypothetical protein
MQCILYKIYFWKVFHMNYNWICTPICTKILFLQKVGVTSDSPGVDEWIKCEASTVAGSPLSSSTSSRQQSDSSSALGLTGGQPQPTI